MDVEAPLLLYKKYKILPDLTMRLSRSVMPPLMSIVDIMPECGSATVPIAQGIVKQVGGPWVTNGIRTSTKHVLVQVHKVLMKLCRRYANADVDHMEKNRSVIITFTLN